MPEILFFQKFTWLTHHFTQVSSQNVTLSESPFLYHLGYNTTPNPASTSSHSLFSKLTLVLFMALTTTWNPSISAFACLSTACVICAPLEPKFQKTQEFC